MKLATLRDGSSTVAARLDGDVYTKIEGYQDVGTLLREADWRSIATRASGEIQSANNTELAPVVPNPPKIFCVGMNYRSHIIEMGSVPPVHPTLFSKFSETLIGATDDIQLPWEECAIDWEAELAVVVGKPGRRIEHQDASDHIAGYSVCNDVSMRSWQFRTSEWLQGKNWEKSTPLGPVLVTSDEWTPGPTIRTSINGQVMQEASTSDLVHDPESLISYISTFVGLRPGDVIITGTPGGVGHAREPKQYIRDGDLVEVSVDGLGTLRNYAALNVLDRAPA